MVGDGDIELGEVAAPPCPLTLPLARPSVGRVEGAEECHQEVLIERVPHEADPPAPHGGEEGGRVDAGERGSTAVVGEPDPGVDGVHVLPSVPEAVPGVPMKDARPIVERPPPGVARPSADGEIAPAAAGERWALGMNGVWEGRSGGGEEEGGGVEDGGA